MQSNRITNWNITSMPEYELSERRKKVFQKVQELGADAIVLFSSKSLFYLTGGALIATERPIVLVLKCDGSSALLVPRLELEHALHVAKNIDNTIYYDEYPGEIHPMVHLSDLLKKMKLEGKIIVADSDGYSEVYGYTGPRLSSLLNINIILKPKLIEEFMIIKSPYEQILIKESARWANLAHSLLQEYTKPGLHEIDVVNKAMCETTAIAVKTLGYKYIPGGMGSSVIQVGYRGQIGKNSYFPHAITNNAKFRLGDTLVSGASSNILNYGSELERTMFIGEPSKEQIEFYNHATALQDIAFNIIKPGIKCSDVDREVMRYYKENNLMNYWRHHTGHALGVGMHEAPFFDSYDNTIIEKGMVFSVEPGLYVENLGGFRLSDTVSVTDDGIEMITYYPREIDRVICGDF